MKSEESENLPEVEFLYGEPTEEEDIDGIYEVLLKEISYKIVETDICTMF